MAKTLNIKAVYTADDRASAVQKRIASAQEGITQELERATKAFDRGDSSVDEYTDSLRKLEKQQRDVDLATKKNVKEQKSLGTQFGKLAKAGAVIAALAAIKRGIQAITEAAAEDADAVAKLNASLKVAGTFSEEASDDIQAFARSIERTIGVNENAVLSGFALAKSFGQTNEAAQELTAAALDFAVAAEIGFTEAIRRMGRATQGSTEDVAKYVPELLKLDKAQLAAGEGTRLIAERFSGLAVDATSDYTTAITLLTNELGNFASGLGEAVVGNETFIDFTRRATVLLREYNDLDKPIEKIKISMDALTQSAEAQGISLVELKDKLGLYVDEAEAAAAASAAWKAEVQKARDESEFMKVALEKLAIGFASAAEAAATDKIEAFIESSAKARATIARLGITLSTEVEEQVNGYRDDLEQIRIETDAGIITADEYRDAQVRIGREIAALNQGYSSYAAMLVETNALTRENIGLTDRQTTSTNKLDRAVTRLATAEQQRAAANRRAILGNPNKYFVPGLGFIGAGNPFGPGGSGTFSPVERPPAPAPNGVIPITYVTGLRPPGEGLNP